MAKTGVVEEVASEKGKRVKVASADRLGVLLEQKSGNRTRDGGRTYFPDSLKLTVFKIDITKMSC